MADEKNVNQEERVEELNEEDLESAAGGRALDDGSCNSTWCCSSSLA